MVNITPGFNATAPGQKSWISIGGYGVGPTQSSVATIPAGHGSFSGGVIPVAGGSNNSTITVPQNTANDANNSGTVLGDSAVGGSGSSNIDPALAAQYGATLDQIKAVLGSLDTQRTQGVQSINNGADLSQKALNQSESAAESSIANQRQTAQQNKVKSLSGIDQNVANTVDSFRRLLAAGHAGNSSFGREFVPLATAREGSQQRQGVFDTDAQNESALDTTLKNAQNSYGISNAQLQQKRNQDLLDFISGINSQRQNLQGQAATAATNQTIAQGGGADSVRAAAAPFQTSAQDTIDQLNALFSQYQTPNYDVAPVSASLPDLSKYTADPIVAALAASNPTVNQAYLPFLPTLKKNNSSLVTA